MQVYDVKVSIQRTVQVKQFEPLQGRVELSANVAEGEDHNAVITRLVADVRSGLKQVGGNSAGAEKQEVSTSAETPQSSETTKDAPATVADKKADAPKATRGRPKGSTAAPKAAPVAAAPVVDDDFAPSKVTTDDDFGGTPAPKAATVAAAVAAEPAKAAVVEDWENAAPAADAITPQALATFLSKSISDKSLAVPDVKALLEKYEVAQSTHLTDVQRPKFKAELDALIATKK